LTFDELPALTDEEVITEDTLSELSNAVSEEVEENKERNLGIAVALMLQEQ
jgi:hypothetical protein